MQKSNVVPEPPICVDGDKPILQEGIRAVILRALPFARIVTLKEKEWEPVLLVLCVSSQDKVPGMLLTYRKLYPSIKTVLLYDHASDIDALDCLSLGCCCVASSSLSADSLIQCIRMAENGFSLLDQDIAAQLVEETGKYHRFVSLLHEEIHCLTPTPREIKIAKGILQGLDNERIGKKLCLSPGTVKNCVTAILEKYGFSSRAQIISLLAL